MIHELTTPLRYVRSVSLSLLGVMLSLSVVAQEPDPADDPDVQASIRLFSAWMEGQLAYRGIPGVVVGVVAGDDLVWTQGFGHADIASDRPMTPDARFRMASHSKLFTATAIMQLREQGLLRLDDPVTQYLPWFEVQTAAPDDAPITLEHLLTHSSGLPREAGPHWSDFAFPSAAQLQALLPGRQAAFSPETRWKYSNLAYTLAGMVVEQVSGQSWAGYLQANIFDPLAMTASSIDREDPKLATGYGRRMPDGSRAIMPFVDARAMASATGLTSTMEDMARFVSAQFREGARGDNRVLSTASLREMHRVRMLENDWTRGQGIGFAVMRVDDRLYVGHGGGYPGFTTHTRIQLDDEIGVIVLTNTNDSGPSHISAELMKTVGQAVARATQAEPEAVEWQADWARFAGIYRSTWADMQVVLMNEQLVLLRPDADSIDVTQTLEPLGEGRFLLKAPSGGSAVGEVVRFVEEDGRSVRMITGDSYADRIP